MRHWGEYREIRAALRPLLTKWWRRVGIPWAAIAIVAGVVAAFATVPFYAHGQPSEETMLGFFWIPGALRFLAGVALVLLWLAAAREADMAVDKLAAGAGELPQGREAKLRFMAYLSQGIVPIIGTALIGICSQPASMTERYLMVRSLTVLEQQSVTASPQTELFRSHVIALDDVLSLLKIPIESVLIMLVFMLIVFSLLAILRNWKVAFYIVIALQVLNLMLSAGISFLSLLHHSERTYRSLVQYVPLQFGWVLGIAMLFALFACARKRYFLAFGILLLLYIISAVTRELTLVIVPGTPHYGAYSVYDYLFTLLAAPYRFIATLPFTVSLYITKPLLAVLGFAGNILWVALCYWLALLFVSGHIRLDEAKAIFSRVRESVGEFIMKGPSA